MTDYLKAACAYVGATPEQVMVSRVDEANQVFVLVIDNGIKGCPKFEIPLSELTTTKAASAESEQPAAETEAPAPKTRTRKKK
jgi:hypothetical protein